MDKPGYIVPPPGLIPSSPQESSETVRLTDRKPLLPVFVPAGPGGIPAATPPAAASPDPSPPTSPAPVVASVTPPAPTSPAVSEAQWSLTLHDGSIIYVTGTLLLGRDPGRIDGWASAGLLRINDPEKSVSKTHAAIDCSGGEFVITDLHSTNGTAIVTSAGVESVIDPDVAVSIPAGSVVELGRYRIAVGRH